MKRGRAWSLLQCLGQGAGRCSGTQWWQSCLVPGAEAEKPFFFFHSKQWQTVPYIPFLWHFPLRQQSQTSISWFFFFSGVSLKTEEAGGKELSRQAEKVSKSSRISQESVSCCWCSCDFFFFSCPFSTAFPQTSLSDLWFLTCLR